MREALKWGDTRLRIHLEELVEMEYVVPLSGRFGQTYQYRLLYTANRRAGALSGRLEIGGAVAPGSRHDLAGVRANLDPKKGTSAPNHLAGHFARCEVQNAVHSPIKQGF